jgi:hypothetical protein
MSYYWFFFIDDKFTQAFTSTIGLDFTTKNINVRGKDVQLQLWDTAGQEKFFNMTRSYYVRWVNSKGEKSETSSTSTFFWSMLEYEGSTKFRLLLYFLRTLLYSIHASLYLFVKGSAHSWSLAFLPLVNSLLFKSK